MPKITAAPWGPGGLALIATLAACAPPEGTGFNGIGAEPQVSPTNPFDPVGAGPVTVTGKLAPGVPQLVTKARRNDTSYNAETAILTAARNGSVSQEVLLKGMPQLLSVVWVGQTPFAVLRPTAGQAGRMDPAWAADFRDNATGLTGCPAAGAVQVHDGNRNRDGVTGMAVPLACST
ncbi:MAG: hypothetical protein CML68_21255 [Rhodobacteraceae bacterium]|nr:hypothetical protein [Paracoccaceae bacterium]